MFLKLCGFSQVRTKIPQSFKSKTLRYSLHGLLGRVASTYNLAFSYDRFGNMTCTQNQNTHGLCPQYSFSASTNQISNSGYTYDASGDLTNDGVHLYQYDAEGRQVSVDSKAFLAGEGGRRWLSRHIWVARESF
ncbi:MAG: hypothetical protein ACRD18_11090 [Terriglobia bacterium]